MPNQFNIDRKRLKDAKRDLALLKAEILDKLNESKKAHEQRIIARKINNDFFGFNLKSSKRGEYCSRFLNNTNAPHLVLYSDLPLVEMQKYKKHANEFINYIEQEYFPLNKKFKPTVIIFQNRKLMQEFAKKNFNRNRKITGHYNYKWNTCIIYGYENYRYLNHELMHAINRQHILLQEDWAAEGLSELFQHSYQDRQLDINNSIKFLRKRLKKRKPLTLTEHISCMVNRGNKMRHEYHLVATFLASHDKLKNYLDLARKGCRRGYSTVFEAAFDKPATELEPLWVEFTNKIFETKKPSS